MSLGHSQVSSTFRQELMNLDLPLQFSSIHPSSNELIALTTLNHQFLHGGLFRLVCRNDWSRVSLSRSDLVFVFACCCRPRGHRIHFGVHYNHRTRRQTLFTLFSFLRLPRNFLFWFMASACLFSVAGHSCRKHEKISHLHFYRFSIWSV